MSARRWAWKLPRRRRGVRRAPKVHPPDLQGRGRQRPSPPAGKGLTLDSGGYNIKAGAGSMIEMMKFDMGGAGATLGAAKIIAQTKPAGVEAHFIVASCENMIGSRGLRPGDILTASNGKTIEVNNTDAEGRFTLADALVYAEEDVRAPRHRRLRHPDRGLHCRPRATTCRHVPSPQRRAAASRRSVRQGGRRRFVAHAHAGYDVVHDDERVRGHEEHRLPRRRFHHRGSLKRFIEKDTTKWGHLDIAALTRVGMMAKGGRPGSPRRRSPRGSQARMRRDDARIGDGTRL